MRAILALAVGIFTTGSVQARTTYDLNWLLENMDSVKVMGSERVDLEPFAPLADVLKSIEKIENTQLNQIVDVDRCVYDRNDNGVRCALLFANRYMIRYGLKKSNGQYEVVSPAILIIKLD